MTVACMAKQGFRFSIDRGGTFTDIYAELPDGSTKVHKLLSVDPQNYPDAPAEGIRRIIAEYNATEIKDDEDCPIDQIDWIRMGTTVATNALLERKGVDVVLAVTHGFEDALTIGTQARPKIFDLTCVKPELLYK
eukprot:gene7217-2684_t